MSKENLENGNKKTYWKKGLIIIIIKYKYLKRRFDELKIVYSVY
jgi:hypothetical protein